MADRKPTNWALLESLRSGYLGGVPGVELADYWQSDEHLLAYDQTFAERIGWKWRAVLDSLRAGGYAPPRAYSLYEFGTGTGVAPRIFFDVFAPEQAVRARLSDRSARAVAYAAKRLGEAQPLVSPTPWDCWREPLSSPAVLLISHVLTELSQDVQAALIELAKTAHTVIWVEPGTSAASRALLDARQGLRLAGAKILAPCPHQQDCGLLTADNERHWCHMFARPPSQASQSAFWAEFGKRMKIDLRALPVSYLVSSRDEAARVNTQARVIGRPRVYKGFLKVLTCDHDGVREQTILKRTSKERYKELADGEFDARVRRESPKNS